MEIQRWQPISELVSLRQAMDRLFDDFGRPSLLSTATPGLVAPALDVYQTASEVVVKAALPGVKPEDLKIDITGDTLSIRGESKEEEEVKREDYLYRERRYGSFSRSVVLPVGVRSDEAEASMDDGILTLTIPKAEEIRPRAIQVKAREKSAGSKRGAVKPKAKPKAESGK